MKQGMFASLNPSALLFIDVETVPMVRNFKDLPERMQSLWIQKCYRIGILTEANVNAMEESLEAKSKEKMLQAAWEGNAALYPEFLKIACVVIGYYMDDKHVTQNTSSTTFNTETFVDEDEKQLLSALRNALDAQQFLSKKLIAHNGRNFDYPVLTKRFLINKVALPNKLWSFGKKPWEIDSYDTAEIWKFGGFGTNHSASLDLISGVFDLPSPKETMKGADVWKYYYDDSDWRTKVAKYCTDDVISLAQIVQAFTGNAPCELKFL
jgi:DNA polymerase elongation subunit (family B)